MNQEPEIDLAMDCEEEEFVFISPPPTPPPPPPPSLTDIQNPSEIELDTSNEDKSKEDIEIIDDEPEKPEIVNVQDHLDSSDSVPNLSRKNPTKNLSKQSVTDLNKEDLTLDLKTVKRKQMAKIPTKPGQSSKTEMTIEEPLKELVEEKVLNESSVKAKAPAPTAHQPPSYSAILAKFYSRRHGSILPGLVELDPDANKKIKSQLPPDLRIGNYPAKVD